MACLINPSCKRLQAGIICPHMQSIPVSPIQVQQLPPLPRRPPPPPPALLEPLRLPPTQNVILLPLHHPHLLLPRAIYPKNTILPFPSPSPQKQELSREPSIFRRVIVRRTQMF